MSCHVIQGATFKTLTIPTRKDARPGLHRRSPGDPGDGVGVSGDSRVLG